MNNHVPYRRTEERFDMRDKFLSLCKKINTDMETDDDIYELDANLSYSDNDVHQIISFDSNTILRTWDWPSNYKEMLEEVKMYKNAYNKLYLTLFKCFENLTNDEIEDMYGIGIKK